MVCLWLPFFCVNERKHRLIWAHWKPTNVIKINQTTGDCSQLLSLLFFCSLLMNSANHLFNHSPLGTYTVIKATTLSFQSEKAPGTPLASSSSFIRVHRSLLRYGNCSTAGRSSNVSNNVVSTHFEHQTRATAVFSARFWDPTRLDCLQPKRGDSSFLQPNVPARVRVEFSLEPWQTSLQNQMQRRSGRTEEHAGQTDSILHDKTTRMRSSYQRFWHWLCSFAGSKRPSNCETDWQYC